MFSEIRKFSALADLETRVNCSDESSSYCDLESS